MNKFLQILILLLLGITSAKATKLKGYVYDKQTGEAIVGATVILSESNRVTSTGLDGSFEFKAVKAGPSTLKISYVTYKTIIQAIVILEEDNPKLKFFMEGDAKVLDEVSVKSTTAGNTDQSARKMEKEAAQLMNIVSSKAIEISPDLTVANVMQRVSGISLERNSNGDGQYAIIRGMDKRYNNTLVNGVKIPSPDNKYRYISLDIFPSDLVDRIEVYKTLTPNLEADAIGGAINLVMKNASSSRLQINSNLAMGYNQLFFDRSFGSFQSSGIKFKSPYEINGKNYNATQADFSKGTLDYRFKNPAPNLVGSLSASQRFLNDKLGLVVAGSYQNTYRGSNSVFYNNAVTGTNAFATITSKSARLFSEQQTRLGLHGKLDYVFDENNTLSFYNVYVSLKNQQLRDGKTTVYNGVYQPDAGNAELVYDTRSRLTAQQIYNATLHGEHKLLNQKFKIQWSAVYATAKNDVPDNTLITLNGLSQNFVDKRTSLVNSNPVTRRWERNTDEDLAGYLDLTYRFTFGENKLDASAGGLYRDKKRSSFFNNYNLAPNANDVNDVFGVDFQNYTDLNLVVVNPTGAVANSLTYDASEKTGAGYGMLRFFNNKVDVTAGARVEHTNQGYNLLFPAGESNPKGNQIYTDVLPSINLKYFLDDKSQLHTAYYKALNRPGFYEIVPSKVVNEEFQERGNPNLKRALADNFDLRYELFSGASAQFLLGAFYKRIKNPIEYTFIPDATRGQDIYYTPGNFGTANNYGGEVDYIKYFNKIGIKANYTYTHSKITTTKTVRNINPTTGDIQAVLVNQSRPLFGQSEHIANLSVLFKDTKKGIDAQLAGAYTGPRINTVSQFLNNDLWQEGFIQVDISAEKRFKHGFSVFIKANNLLNTPSKLYIKGTNPENDKIKEDLVKNGRTLIRSDFYGQSYLAGFRYKLN